MRFICIFFQEVILLFISHLAATYALFLSSHRAMFKLGAKNLFLLCLLIRKKSAVYSADRCNFSEPETDCSRNGNNLYKSWVEGALNSGPFGHFRFANHLFNWQILIKVWISFIGSHRLVRTILEYKKNPPNLNFAGTWLPGWAYLGPRRLARTRWCVATQGVWGRGERRLLRPPPESEGTSRTQC